MRTEPVLFWLVASAFASALGACTSFVETTPPPAKPNLLFTRDLYKGNGCVEYSWGSERNRRLIQLNPDIKEHEGDGPIAKDASHVQVYALTNGLYGLQDWQFPPGPPHPSPVVGATIEVKQTEAVGTVYYQDRSSASDTKALAPMRVTCPAAVQAVAILDPQIKDLDPRRVPRNTAATITLSGAHFTKDSVVLIDGANATTTFVSSSVLEAALEADDLATPGKRSVKVHGAKEGTTSNEVVLTVE